MQSGRLVELLEQLAAQFNWIIIDSPPILPLADTSVWSLQCGQYGILLITGKEQLRKRQLKRGLEALNQSKLLGVVLNRLYQCRPQQLLSAVWPGCATHKSKQ